MIEPEAIGSLVAALRARSTIAPIEVTLEANPEDLNLERLERYAEAGVTRLSLGVQSLDAQVLRRVGRLHDADRSIEALRDARAVGLDRSVDLIVGLPDESFDRWLDGVDRLLAEDPEHLSLYTLEIDKTTPLARAIDAGRERVVRGLRLVEAFHATRRRVLAAGLDSYELASFARPGKESRHNLKYWTEAWYGGFGLGAHGYAHGARRGNLGALDAYLAAVEAGRDPRSEFEGWDPQRRFEEALFCGLRRTEGLELDRLAERYGCAPCGALEPLWDEAVGEGTLERSAGRIRFTEQGLTEVDRLLERLLGRPEVARAFAHGD